MSNAPGILEQLPVENPVVAGDGGGYRDEKGEFSGYAWKSAMEAMALEDDTTQEARATRDRKLHLLHNTFVECCARRYGGSVTAILVMNIY